MKFHTAFIFTCCCLYLANGRIFQGRMNPLRFYFSHLKHNPTQFVRPFSRLPASSPLFRQSNIGSTVLSNQFLRPGVNVSPKIVESVLPVDYLSFSYDGPFDRNHPFTATLKKSIELHRAQGLYKANSVMHIELDIEGSKMQYKTGDHVGVYLQNDPELVDHIGNLLKIDLDKEFSPTENGLERSFQRPLPSKTTYRIFLTNFVELKSIPADKFESLAKYCSDANDRESMIHMVNADQRESVVNLNIVPTLESFKSFKPPIDVICKVMPALQPQLYAISSSSKMHPNTLHITIEQDQHTLKQDGFNKGALSFFLPKEPEQLRENPIRIPVFIQPREINLPADKPVIMIGSAGEGLAPLRGFIFERDFLFHGGKTVGATTLYLGARSKNEFFYQDEFNRFVQSGSLKMRTTISTDEPEEISVARVLNSDADLVWNVIQNDGYIFISERKFPTTFRQEIQKVLLNIIARKGNMDEASAQEILMKMLKEERYISTSNKNY